VESLAVEDSTLTPGLLIGAGVAPRAASCGRVVLDELLDDPIDLNDTKALDEALNRYGYTVKVAGWTTLPGGVRYGAALPGHLAERDWWRLARVRITRETPADRLTRGSTARPDLAHISVQRFGVGWR
jgi:hypothetical protein